MEGKSNRSSEETRSNEWKTLYLHCLSCFWTLGWKFAFFSSRLVEFSTFWSDRSPSSFQTCPKLNKKREGVWSYRLSNFLFRVGLGVWLVKIPAYLTSAFMIGVQRLTGIKTGLLGRGNWVWLVVVCLACLTCCSLYLDCTRINFLWLIMFL